MSQLFIAKLPNLKIPNGSNVSNALIAGGEQGTYEDATFVMIYSPVAMDALTFTLQVTDDPNAQVVIYDTFQLGDTPSDANLPAAGRARAYLELGGAGAFRIMASGSVGSDHIWRLTKVFKA